MRYVTVLHLGDSQEISLLPKGQNETDSSYKIIKWWKEILARNKVLCEVTEILFSDI